MRDYETLIRKAVEQGETIEYVVTPLYRGNELVPNAVTLLARGNRGFRLHLSVLNR